MYYVYCCFYHSIMYWSIQLQSCQSVYNKLTYLLTYLLVFELAKSRQTESVQTFDFDGEGGRLTAGLVRHLHLVQSCLVRPDAPDVEAGVPGVGLDGRLDPARRQRSAVEEPLGGRVRVPGEVDVDVDARSRSTAQRAVEALVELEHRQLCNRTDNQSVVTTNRNNLTIRNGRGKSLVIYEKWQKR